MEEIMGLSEASVAFLIAFVPAAYLIGWLAQLPDMHREAKEFFTAAGWVCSICLALAAGCTAGDAVNDFLLGLGLSLILGTVYLASFYYAKYGPKLSGLRSKLVGLLPARKSKSIEEYVPGT